MAWTQPPRTWTDGELVTASIMNTHVRDQFLETWHKIARKTADQSVTSSTALQSDNHLSITVGSTDAWVWDTYLIIVGGPGDIKTSWSIPTSGTLQWSISQFNETGTTTYQHTFLTATDGANIAFFGEVGSPGVIAVMHCAYVGGGTAGTVTLRWAQNSSSGTATTLKANSCLIGAKVN